MNTATTLFLLLLAPLASLVVVGVAMIVRARRRATGYPACGACRYDVTGTLGTSARCPECGADLMHVGVIGAGEARNRLGAKLVIVAVLLVVVALVPIMVVSAARSRAEAAAARRQAAIAQLLQRQAVAAQTQAAATAPAGGPVQSENDP